MDVQVIELARIRMPEGRLRGIDRHAVGRLAASIRERGLLTAITVRPLGSGYELVVGAHRLEAHREIGAVDIAARVVALGDLEARMVEIDENLVRADLTVLERAEHLAERKRVYLLQHPETKHGTAGALASNVVQGNGNAVATVATAASFVASTAAQTGIAARTIQRDVQIAEALTEDVRMALRGSRIASSTRTLTALAALAPKDQRAVVGGTDLRDAGAVKAAADARAPKLGPKRGGRRARPVREVVQARPAAVVRFVYTLGGLDLFLQIEPSSLRGELTVDEATAYRDIMARLDAWRAAFDEVVVTLDEAI